MPRRGGAAAGRGGVGALLPVPALYCKSCRRGLGFDALPKSPRRFRPPSNAPLLARAGPRPPRKRPALALPDNTVRRAIATMNVSSPREFDNAHTPRVFGRRAFWTSFTHGTSAQC